MSESDRSQESSRPVAAQSAESNLLELQIKRHKRADSNGSYLGKAVDWVSSLVWNQDGNTLAAMESLSAQIDNERRAGNQTKVAQIETSVKELVKADQEALAWRKEVNHYGTGFLKSAGLFMPGATGRVASVLTHGLDQAHYGDSLTCQIVDGGLGATKGLVLSKAFGMLGGSSFSAPLKGVLMGTGSAGIDMALNRRNYMTADGKSYDLSSGLSKVAAHVSDPAVWLADGGAFVAAHGLSGMLGTASGGYLQSSRLLSTVLTGASFGLTNGALGEVQRQRAAGEEIDFGKVAFRSILQGGIDTIAALPGGVAADASFRGSVRKLFEVSRPSKLATANLEGRSVVDKATSLEELVAQSKVAHSERPTETLGVERRLQLGRGLPTREQFERAEKDGWIESQKAVIDGRELTIYNYSRKAQSQLHWDQVVSASRGLIVCDRTGEVVALPLEKFFELGERVSPTERAKPRDGAFDALVKVDGSFGIMYRAGQRVHWSTRGALQSDNAKVAEAIWDAKYSQHDQLLSGELNHLSLMAEIVHPKTQVVCRYGFEDLVLLAARNRFTGKELAYEEVCALGKRLGMPVVERVPFDSVEPVLEQAKRLDHNHEGYVLCWPDGYRLKVKGAEYQRLHGLLSDYNNSYAAGNWLNGTLVKAYREVPEHFHGDIKRHSAALDERLARQLDRLDSYYKDAPKEDVRSFNLWVNQSVPEELRSQLRARRQAESPDAAARLARLSLATLLESGRYNDAFSSPAERALGASLSALEQALARHLWDGSRPGAGEGLRQLNQLVDKVPQSVRGALNSAVARLSPETALQQLRTSLTEKTSDQSGSRPSLDEVFKEAPEPDAPLRLHHDWTASQPTEVRPYLDRWRAAGRFETAEGAARQILATAVRKGQAVETLSAFEKALNLSPQSTAERLLEFEGRLSQVWQNRPPVVRQALLLDWANQAGVEQPVRQILLEQAWVKQREGVYEQYLLQMRAKPAASDTKTAEPAPTLDPLQLPPKLELPAVQAVSLADLQSRLEVSRTDTAVFRVTKNGAMPAFDSPADFIASATDAVSVPVRVYKVKGHSTEIIVPEDYARELDLIRAVRLRAAGQDVSLKDVPNIRLLDRALPEDFIPLLDKLPNASLVRQLILDPNRNAMDAWHANAEKDPAFKSIASASEDGTRVTFFQKDVSRQTLTELQHEWSHLFRKQVQLEARMFDIAATLEKDGFTGRDQRLLADPHEKWSALLGERFLSTSTTDFVELCERAPVQTVMLAEALNRSLLYMDSRARNDFHFALAERLQFVKANVRPRAVSNLTDRALSSSDAVERGNAVRLLVQLGEAGRLKGSTSNLNVSLSGEPVGDTQLRALKGVPVEVLDISYTGASNIAFLSDASSLKVLNLSGTKIRAGALAPVAAAQSLERLNLANTDVDDSAVHYLQRARSLRSLDVRNTRISPAAVARMRAALPACEIAY